MCNPVEEVKNLGSSIDDAIIAPVVKAGSQLDDFVNEAIPGGWLTVALATGAYFGAEAIAAGNAAETAALAEGATAAEAAAAGQAAATAAEAATVAGAEGALGTGLSTSAGTIGSVEGLSGVLGAGETVAGAGTGFTAVGAGVPEIAAMGGGTGLLTSAAGGGTLGATGVTSAGAVPMLGDSASFINNPDVLGTPVIGAEPSSTISVKDALDMARMGQKLFGDQPAPAYNPQMPSSQLSGTVDYSQLLGLLTSGKAKTPTVYQSLLGTRYG